MSLFTPADEDRRRRPRFSCCGEAKIVYLPSNGLFLPGRMRDLSLGGCCAETASALEVLRRELERGGLHAVLLNQRLPVVGVTPSQARREEAPIHAAAEPVIVNAQAEIVPVDLFV